MIKQRTDSVHKKPKKTNGGRYTYSKKYTYSLLRESSPHCQDNADFRVFFGSIYMVRTVIIQFYADLVERIIEPGFENLNIRGHWNLVLDFALYYYNYNTLIIPRHKSRKTSDEKSRSLKKTVSRMRQYTMRRNIPLQQSGLICIFDFRLIVHLRNRCRRQGWLPKRSFHDHTDLDIKEIRYQKHCVS